MTSILDTKSPLLWRACLAGDVGAMEKAMEQGVDPRKMDRNGENCLHMCARSGEVDAFERMVREGLNLNTSNQNGQTPLHVAVGKGHTGVVRYIVRSGGDTNLKSKFSGMTALHLSCVENEEDIVKFLLDNGANCAIQDAIGKYPDDYSRNDSILEAFEYHFPVCTHGRKKEKGSKGSKGREKVEKNATVTAAIVDEVVTRNEVKEERRRTERNEEYDEDEDSDKDDENKSRMKRKEKKRSSKREKGHLADREGVEIYDKMEHYNVERAKVNWDKAKQGGKKIKINHSLGFSNEHKERMSQNVFDRLMGGKKK